MRPFVVHAGMKVASIAEKLITRVIVFCNATYVATFIVRMNHQMKHLHLSLNHLIQKRH